MNILLKIAGIILFISGVVLTFNPDLLWPSETQPAGYAMIEKRVKWGILIGLGAFLVVFQQWGQWGLTIWALLALLTCGIIISRLLGFLLDGFFAKQILWLLIEVVLAIAFILLYRRKSPFLLTALFLCCSASVLKAQVFEKTPELQGDTVVFSLTLIDVYPFIPGTVNGIGGKFMFDTGYQTSISLNDNFIELPNKKAKSSGVTGSGQSFKTNVNDTITEIRFGNGIIYRKLLNISSANYDFLQKNITPDFIGFIGHDFFKGYLFKLDYLHRKVTFYRPTAERTRARDFLKNEKVLAVINFEIRKLANHPIIRLKIDGINVLGVFDTGQNGLLQLDASSAKLLKSRGSVLRSGTDSYGDTLLNVKNIIIGGKLKTNLNGLVHTELKATQIEREKSGITEPNLMNIGYRFLAQYKTVWDYAQKKIYILEY